MSDDVDFDPFSEQNARSLGLIMQFRIYDALMEILRHTDETSAKELLEMHWRGAVLGSAPAFDYQFLTNVLNDVEEEEDDQ